MDTNKLIEARKKAEQAVADMADGELKLKAFGMFLEKLLSADNSGDSGFGSRKRTKGRARAGRDASETQKKDAAPAGSVPARIIELKEEGFFTEERGIREIQDELRTHGWRYDLTALSGPLMRLVRKRDLRRLQVNDGNKAIYKYFNP
jgi:hypothetical protein